MTTMLTATVQLQLQQMMAAQGCEAYGR